MTINSLSNIPFESVLEAFQKAFCDYAVEFNRKQIADMLVRRGFCPHLSFAAFENDEIVAFTLNGAGPYNGITSCYDCGTGTLPAFRGQGIAGQLFRYSIPYLKEAGIKQYVLEVLQDNTAAINVYRANGFEITSEYDCYNQSIDRLRLDRPYPDRIEFHPLQPEALSGMEHFCDFKPSWQNDLNSISRGKHGLLISGAFLDGNPVGYCVLDPVSGDVTQIAVDRQHRRQGIATALLANSLKAAESPSIKILNIATNEKTLPAFLLSLGVEKGLSQFAMCRNI